MNKISTPRQSPHADTVRRVCEIIDAAEDGAPTLAELGRAVDLSPYHLQRIFKKATGMSPRDYADSRRETRLKEQLRKGSNVTDAMYEAGFSGPSRLYENAKSSLGMTPASFGKGGKGAVISYGFGQCSIGHVIVAATEHGICFVGFGDSEPDLIGELAADYPAAELREDADAVSALIDVVAALTDHGAAPAIDVALDVQATAFQRLVWDTLQSIPAGQTMTYGKIAEAIGKPKAARAVGRACATNPVSMVIPCHRAVGSTGALTGYRWGTARKSALLRAEQGRSS